MSDEIVEARPGQTVTPKRCAGYCQESAGIRYYTLHAKAFVRWFSSRAQAAAILRWLNDQDDLIAEKYKYKPSLKSVQWAERACRWPGGMVVKSIRMRDPFLSASRKKAA